MARTKVKVGVVGVGGMGAGHCSCCDSVSEVKLTAVCDIDPERAAEMGEKHKVPHFLNHKDLIKSGLVDGITIATPHYFHPPIAIDAFRAGLHVLSEKPIAVQTSQAARMIKAAEKSGKVFAVMFQQRTTPQIRLARKLMEQGVLGEMRRTLLVMPSFRRGVGGSIFFAAILLGIGLGEIIGWPVTGAAILIALGISTLIRGLSRSD